MVFYNSDIILFQSDVYLDCYHSTPQFFFVLLGVMIINMGIHYWNKQNLFEYLGTIPQLLILTRVAKKLLKCKILERDK